MSVIIVKDLSRLGRNHLETGLLIEQRFPQLNVRFIAINDNVDSQNNNYDDFMPIRNLMNEWYVRDTSRKIRAAIKAKGSRGDRVSSIPPYGYRKDPDNPKNKIVVDDESAAVVKKIYSLCVEGNGPSQIANILENQKVLSPFAYKIKNNIINSKNIILENPYNWNSSVVAEILDRYEYLGHTINFKYTTKSYKDKRRYKRPKEDNLIFKNTHEPIIDFETWSIVSSIRKNKRRRTNYDFQDKFSGLVFCADCGTNMVVHRCKGMSPDKIYFACRNYKKVEAEIAQFI